jgi:hypothetical protein
VLTKIEYPASDVNFIDWKLITNQPVELYYEEAFLFDKKKNTVLINSSFEVWVINYNFDTVCKKLINKENKFYSHEIEYKYNIYPCNNCVGIGKVIFIDEITKDLKNKLHNFRFVRSERGIGKIILSVTPTIKFLYRAPARPIIKNFKKLCGVCYGTGIHAVDKHFDIKPLVKEILKQ